MSYKYSWNWLISTMNLQVRIHVPIWGFPKTGVAFLGVPSRGFYSIWGRPYATLGLEYSSYLYLTSIYSFFQGLLQSRVSVFLGIHVPIWHILGPESYSAWEPILQIFRVFGLGAQRGLRVS